MSITGTTILVPYFLSQVTATIIWRSGTRRWNLRVPDLRMNCRGLMTWQGTSIAAKLPACTTATAHTFAFEFDLVMGLMAIFSNKQTEVSTGEKTYDMTVYEIWKHAAWSKHAVKSWLFVKHPVGWMLFAWHFFNRHLDTEKRLSTTTMRWLGKPQQ